MAKIVFFTGSGISQPSGIETFRDNGDGTGLWMNQKIQDVAMFHGFKRDPLKVHNFYNTLRNNINHAEPNLAHIVISELQKEHQVSVITQNIDNLHEKAGSKDVLHLHGKHDHLYCLECKHLFSYNKNWTPEDHCPNCKATYASVRPYIVWFYENLDSTIFSKAEELCRQADLFVQIGTSAQVNPAATLIKRVKVRRKKVEMNLMKSFPKRPYTFHHYYLGNIIHSIPEFKKDLPELLALKEKGIFRTFRHNI